MLYNISNYIFAFTGTLIWYNILPAQLFVGLCEILHLCMKCPFSLVLSKLGEALDDDDIDVDSIEQTYFSTTDYEPEVDDDPQTEVLDNRPSAPSRHRSKVQCAAQLFDSWLFMILLQYSQICFCFAACSVCLLTVQSCINVLYIICKLFDVQCMSTRRRMQVFV